MSELSKIKWRCRRGMRELDVVLNNYVEKSYVDASPEEQQAFKELLDQEDDIFYQLLLGNRDAETDGQSELLKKLRVASVLVGTSKP